MPSADRLPETLHYLLMKHVIETGFAPNIQKLSELAGLPQPETEAGLQQLAAMHGVILVPNSYEVWSLHPFSMLPTRHWVSTPQRGWWANCAWCSLAIAAALEPTCKSPPAMAAKERHWRLGFRMGGRRVRKC